MYIYISKLGIYLNIISTSYLKHIFRLNLKS